MNAGAWRQRGRRGAEAGMVPRKSQQVRALSACLRLLVRPVCATLGEPSLSETLNNASFDGGATGTSEVLAVELVNRELETGRSSPEGSPAGS